MQSKMEYIKWNSSQGSPTIKSNASRLLTSVLGRDQAGVKTWLDVQVLQ